MVPFQSWACNNSDVTTWPCFQATPFRHRVLNICQMFSCPWSSFTLSRRCCIVVVANKKKLSSAQLSILSEWKCPGTSKNPRATGQYPLKCCYLSENVFVIQESEDYNLYCIPFVTILIVYCALYKPYSYFHSLIFFNCVIFSPFLFQADVLSLDYCTRSTASVHFSTLPLLDNITLLYT